MRRTITFLICAVFTWVLSAQPTVQIEGGASYTSITEAITNASDGDVILIGGIHTEPISIGKSITLRGADPTMDIIQAAGSASNDGSGERVIYISEGNYNITIENLGVRYGNIDKTGEPDPKPSSNGGGIFADKVTGMLTLNNLILNNNYTATNGGAISLAGTNALITNCTIQNNTSMQDGGAIIVAPNNGSLMNSTVNIEQSLIDSNTGRNGGGIYVNGNNQYGNDYLIYLNIENSTISNNNATSASGGNGGGAIFSAAQVWTTNAGGDGSTGNINLSLLHTTVYNNSHAAATKAGLRFGSNALTNFSAYNSIIVSADLISVRAINFQNCNTTDVVNCILGGLENAGPSGALTYVDDANKNNLKGRTATESGLDIASGLQSLGGKTQVFAILDKSGFAYKTADDYCTAAVTGITVPAIDQRGYTREGVVDAGAYEFGATLSTKNVALEKMQVNVFPNPAKDFVMIQSANSIESIRLYSVLGALEKTIYKHNEFSVLDLSSGMYIMVMESNGQKLVKRLIVE